MNYMCINYDLYVNIVTELLYYKNSLESKVLPSTCTRVENRFCIVGNNAVLGCCEIFPKMRQLLHSYGYLVCFDNLVGLFYNRTTMRINTLRLF